MRSFLFNAFFLQKFLQTNEMRSKLEFLDTVVVNAGVSVCVYLFFVYVYIISLHTFSISQGKFSKILAAFVKGS